MDSFSETQFENNFSLSDIILQNYQIVREIARGGMGIVYEASQLSPQRSVAIKVIQANHIGIHAKRFEREIEIAANLSHPNIAGIYSVERQPKLIALVMEYVDGISFKEYIEDKNIAFTDKLKVFVNACEALKYAHDNKVIHRDLKPANIMVTKNGQSKLIDFGVAKQTNQRFDLTKTGEIMGTPKYMAPEQIAGLRNEVNQQTDIYAMGVVLYQLMTSQEMIEGDAIFEILFNITHQKIISPRQLNRDIDKNLEKIWKMAVARNKKERYQNIGDMVVDLEHYLAGRSITRSLSRSFTKPKYILLTAGVLILTAILYYSRFQEKEITFSELQISPEEQLILSKSSLDAINEYEKNPDLHNNSLLQRHIVKSYCELRNETIDKFHRGEVTETRTFFEFLRKKFPFDPEIIEYLAKTYLPKEVYYGEKYVTKSPENLEKANKLLETCTTLDPYNAKYFFLLGKILYSQDKYEEAYKKFQYCLDLDKENIEALEILCKIPYHEPSLQDGCYQYVVSVIAGFTKFTKVNLFAPELKLLENTYIEDYLLYLSLTQNSADQKMLDVFSQVDHLKKKQNIEKVVLSFRYHESFEQNLELLPQGIKNQLDVEEIVKKAQEMRSQEYKNFCYYLVTYMFNNQNWQHPNLKQEDKKDTFQKMLSEIITSELEHSFIIYCAAKAYIELFGFSDFLNPNQNKKLPHKTQIIITAILRDINIPFDTQVFHTYESISNIAEEENHFLQYLIADTMYLTVKTQHEYYYFFIKDTFRRKVQDGKIVVSEDEIQTLQKIMAGNHEKAKVSAVMALFHLRSIQFKNSKDPAFISMHEFLEDIKKVLAGNNSLLKNYIHSSFWLNQHIRDNIGNFAPMYVRGLQDKDFEVRKKVTLLYNRVIPILGNAEVINVLKNIFGKEENKTLRFYAIAAYARGNGLTYDVFKETIESDHPSDFERLYGGAFFLYNKINYFENIKITVDAVIKFRDDIKKTNNVYFQLFNLYFFSLLGYHHINVQQENSEGVKNLLYQLYREADIKVNDKMSFNLLSGFFAKVGPLERLGFAKKYMNKNNFIRYAIPPYIALQKDENKRGKFFEKYSKGKGPLIQQAVALGYYRSLEREVGLTTPKYFRNITSTIPKKNYLEYIDYLRDFLTKTNDKDSAKFDLYGSWLEKASLLHPQESKYWFEKAIFYRIDRKKGRALNYLTKAIEIEPGNYLYYYERAIIYIQRKMNQEAIADLQKTAELMPDYFILQHIAEQYQKLEEYKKAEKIYNQMFLQNPFENPERYLGLVETYLDLGKKEEAMNFLYSISEIYKRKEHNAPTNNNSKNIKSIPRKTIEKYEKYPKIQGILDEFYERYYE